MEKKTYKKMERPNYTRPGKKRDHMADGNGLRYKER